MLFVAIFYYTLGNIPPKDRSKMTSIQIVTITKSSLLIKYGLKVILDPFLKDIETLEKVCYNDFVSFMCTSEWGRSNGEWTKKAI